MAGAYPLAGANVLLRDAEPKFKPGTPLIDDSNQTWVYVEFATAVEAEAPIALSDDFVASSDEEGSYVAEIPAAANEYGWVRKFENVL